MKRHVPLAASLALTVMLNSLSAQTVTWTGNAGNANWNDATNWSPQQVPQQSVGNDVVFGDFGATPLTVALSGSSPHTYMRFANLTVNSAALANLTFAAPTDSIIDNLTVQSGSGLTALNFTSGIRLRVSAASVTWNIASGKTVNLAPTLLNTGGQSRTVTLSGGGLLNYQSALIGTAYALNDNRGVSLAVGSGTTLAFNAGVGQTVSYVSSETSTSQPSLTVRNGGTLIMDVGTGGDLVQYVRATGSGTTTAFQSNWLNVEAGAVLQLNLLSGWQEDTWYTLFRNVGTPANAFTVTGLGSEWQADFRLFEYTSGFYDYQVSVSAVPEPSTLMLGLAVGAGFFMMRRRRVRA